MGAGPRNGADPAAWPAQVHAAFSALGIGQVGFVPDAGLRLLIDACVADPGMEAVGLTTEEEGVALAAGAWLGGQRAALLMQSSGVGNCANMLSLPRLCGVPLLMVVTMRGQWGETNPWQVPMGQATAELLQLCGVLTFPAEDAEDVAPAVEAAGTMAVSGRRAAAVLISQRVVGAKRFD